MAKSKYALPQPKQTDLVHIIKANEINSLSEGHNLKDIASQIELFADISKFRRGEQDWYSPSKKMSQRIKIMKEFSFGSSKIHSELSNVNKFRQFLSLTLIKKILEKQDHINYSLSENQFN